MDSWRGSRKQLRLEVTAPLPKRTQQFGSEVIRWDRMLTASQRPGYHQVLKRPALVKLRDSLRPRATLAPEEAWQSDPLQQAFSARDLSRSAPWRDQSVCEQPLCSCPPKRKCSALSPRLPARSFHPLLRPRLFIVTSTRHGSNDREHDYAKQCEEKNDAQPRRQRSPRMGNMAKRFSVSHVS